MNNSACKPQEFDDLISIIQEKIKIKNNIDLKLEIEKI